MSQGTLFLKLGGSLLTDKRGVEAVRLPVLRRLAAEIAGARQQQPGLRLLLGHGSGSFGHVYAARHGTRQGVAGEAAWSGFAEVAASAARLNRLVVEALLEAGVPALSLPPSASARCQDGLLVSLALAPVSDALAAGLVPVVYGDVAFDALRGGTIVSTEEVMSYLAPWLKPGRFLLAGEVAGVLDGEGRAIPRLTPQLMATLGPALSGSRGTDVTGGMASKVEQMLALCRQVPGLRVLIFSGLEEGLLGRVLLGAEDAGTLITP